MAFRFLRAKRRSLARFTTAVAVAGLAAGVASLILAQALARGFADEMREKILGATPHVSVAPANGRDFSNWREIETEIGKISEIERVAPAAFESAVLVGETETAYAVLQIEPPVGARKPLAGGEIAVGARLAEQLNLKPGDRAEIATIDRQTPQAVRVAAVFSTGLYDYDATWVYVAPEAYARFRGQTTFTPRLLNISVRDIYRSDETARRLRASLGDDYRVVDWQEANRPLFAALALERRVALAIIALIVFVAALNITTTLALLVNERRLDIAVLRVCGARSRGLMTIFALEGLLIGAIGVAAGLAAGLTGAALANHFRLVGLAAEVYAVEFVRLRPAAADCVLIAGAALGAVLAATLYPAFKASRLKPLENLRRQ